MDQRHEIDWRTDNVPVSVQFDDPFYSLDNGLAETRHVFLDGNDLPARFRPGFHVAELGFGTGLNFVAAALAWETSGQRGTLHFTSFEAFPLRATDATKALAAFPEAQPFLELIAAALEGDGRAEKDGIALRVIFGDAGTCLPVWDGTADAWFLDGFSPAKNPELWSASLLQSVFDHTAPDGRFATYTAAGAVRRALAGAGFTVERRPGYGRKRHMTAGWKS